MDVPLMQRQACRARADAAGLVSQLADLAEQAEVGAFRRRAVVMPGTDAAVATTLSSMSSTMVAVVEALDELLQGALSCGVATSSPMPTDLNSFVSRPHPMSDAPDTRPLLDVLTSSQAPVSTFPVASFVARQDPHMGHGSGSTPALVRPKPAPGDLVKFMTTAIPSGLDTLPA